VVSAVGHEIDFSIADFVADLRAPTPSAAAEMVVAAKDEFCNRIDRLTGRLRAAARGDLQRRRNVIHVLSSRRGLAGFQTRMAMRGRYAAELAHELRGAIRRTLESRARAHRALQQRLEQRDLARRRRQAAVIVRTRASARWRGGSRISAHWPFWAAAMLCVGTPIARPSCAAPRRSHRETASTSRLRAAR
jgi:exodeoxyribonuclease VII large subunit